ncbi:MAG: hypothetical protein AB7O32_14305, partial [Vicinamibacterales bacterium]
MRMGHLATRRFKSFVTLALLVSLTLLPALAFAQRRGGGGSGGGGRSGGGGGARVGTATPRGGGGSARGGSGGGSTRVAPGGGRTDGRTSSGGSEARPGRATGRERDGDEPVVGEAVARRGSGGGRPTVIVPGGYYGGYLPWGFGGLGLGYWGGYYDPWY